MILPDVLQPNLDLVLCGTAAGERSAQKQAYYAHPGNRFYRILEATGLTDRLLEPHEFLCLPSYGIGLTDLNKNESGNDDQLSVGGFNVPAFEAKIQAAAPANVAFTSKKAGAAYLGVKNTSQIECGLQTQKLGNTQIWVLPSTSGAASRYWKKDEHCWYNLADEVQRRRG